MTAIEEDEALQSAFLAAWPGADGGDQWWWLHHPGTAAPSGTASWEQRLADARAPLYRRDVDPAVREAFERLQLQATREQEAARRTLDTVRAAVRQQEEDERRDPPPATLRPSRRLLVVGGAVVVVGAVGAAVAALLPRPAPSQPLRVRAAALPTTPEEQARLESAFIAAQAFPRLHAEQLRRRLQNDVDEFDPRALARTQWTIGSVLFRAPAPPGEGGDLATGARGDAPGTGIRVGDTAGNTTSADIDDTAGGVVTVVVMLARPVGWQVDLDLDGASGLTVQGTADRGAVQYAVTRLGEGVRVRHAQVTGPAVPFVWNVTVRA